MLPAGALLAWGLRPGFWRSARKLLDVRSSSKFDGHRSSTVIERTTPIELLATLIYAQQRDKRWRRARGRGHPAAAGAGRACRPAPAGGRAVRRAERRILVRPGHRGGRAA